MNTNKPASNRKEMVGLRFGRLVVISVSGFVKDKLQWNCRCDCGNIVVVNGDSLRRGNTKSCGKCIKYEHRGDITIGIDRKGCCFYFDTEDYQKVSEHAWYVGKEGYVSALKDGRHIYLHRVIMEADKDKLVDHIDHRPNNNCKNNLRIATRMENQRNMRLRNDNKSGYKGVYYNKTKKRYEAQIHVKGKKIPLGYFNTAQEAADAYNQGAIRLFEEFAYLNIV